MCLLSSSVQLKKVCTPAPLVKKNLRRQRTLRLTATLPAFRSALKAGVDRRITGLNTIRINTPTPTHPYTHTHARARTDARTRANAAHTHARTRANAAHTHARTHAHTHTAKNPETNRYPTCLQIGTEGRGGQKDYRPNHDQNR